MTTNTQRTNNSIICPVCGQAIETYYREGHTEYRFEYHLMPFDYYAVTDPTIPYDCYLSCVAAGRTMNEARRLANPRS